MPLFPGERTATDADTGQDEFVYNARPALERHLSPNQGLTPFEWFISVVTTHVEGLDEPYDYFIARPPYNRGSSERRPNSDVWWVWNADVDESEGWVAQATFTAEGLIQYPVGHPRRGQMAEFDMRMADDEGDTIGAPSPRRATPADVDQLIQDALPGNHDRRLPRGNTSVRDLVRHRMADLNPSDATFNSNEDLSGAPRAGFMGRPAPSRRLGEGPPAAPEVEITEDGEVVDALELEDAAPTTAPLDINGNPLVASGGPAAPKSVWERLAANAAEGRPPPVPKTTWERIRDQSRRK